MTRRWILAALLTTSVVYMSGQQLRQRPDPLKSTYLDLRDALSSAHGPEVWSDLQGKLTPIMKLYVVETDSDHLMLGPKEDAPAEVRLELRAESRRTIRVGEQVAFDGIAETLERTPFILGLTQGRVHQPPH